MQVERIRGIRFDIGHAHVQMGQLTWQKETVLHGCANKAQLSNRNPCSNTLDFWSAPKGESVVSITTYQAVGDLGITGLVLCATGGSCSPLLGTSSPSPIVASSSFEGGLCAARTFWVADGQGQSALRTIGFTARKGDLDARCLHLSGDNVYSTRSKVGHHFVADECKRCGRHIAGISVYQRLKRPVDTTEAMIRHRAPLAG